MGEWFRDHLDAFQRLGWIWVGVGVASLIVTAIALPVVVVRLPTDYFVRTQRERAARDSRHPVVALLAVIAKNLVGIAFIVTGAILLFVPGQGILTMLIGLVLTNFPGKYRLERKLVRRPAVLRTLNRVRKAAKRPPLEAPPDVA